MRREFIRSFLRHRPAFFSSLIILGLMVMAILAPFIEPYSPNEPDTSAINKPPSFRHPLGTDQVGRDVLSRVIEASRISLVIGVLSMVVAVTIGIFIGALAGYFGGLVDNLLMRITDIFLSIPALFLLIFLAAFFGGGRVSVIILVIGFLSWMPVARLVRGSFLSLKTQEFVEAARAVGASSFGIIWRHLIPNTLSPIVVAATLGVANAVLLESALSFLGVGVQPPTASWGNMLMDAFAQVWEAPWAIIFPGLMILVAVISINFVGDGLRDTIDPRLKKAVEFKI